MRSFKSFLLVEATGDDVRSIFMNANSGPSSNLYNAASIYADYLENKGNRTKADVIRFYLDDPENLENSHLLERLGRSGLNGFASAYGEPHQYYGDGDYEGTGQPFFPVHLRIGNVYDFFDVTPENRERMEQEAAHLDWEYGGYLGINLPVKKEYAEQAYDMQMSVRQFIAEHPELRDKILDYDNMDLYLVAPRDVRPTGYNNNVPNFERYVLPHGMTQSIRNKLRPLIEREYAHPTFGDTHIPDAMPPILSDYEDYNALLWDLRRMGGRP